jgi:hypothetical protein
MKILKFSTLFLAIAVLMVSCKKDPDALKVTAIEASGTSFQNGSAVTSDLNGSTSATNVTLDATITVTFDKNVKTSSVSSTTVKVSSTSGTVDAAVSASGNKITINPTNDFVRGTLYTLSLSGLQAEDDGGFTDLSRTFTTEGRAPVVVPFVDKMVAYWHFDGSTAEATNKYSTANEVKVSYTNDRFGQGSSALSFDGDETLVEVANASTLLATKDFTLSFWIKSDGSDVNAAGETRGQFVMGLAAWHGFQFEIFGNYGGCKLATRYEIADGKNNAEDLWWSTNGNLGWMGWTFDQDVSAAGGLAGIIKDKWAHVVCTYNATTKIGAMYINGVLRKSQDFNLYGTGHPMLGTVGLTYSGNPAPGDRLAFGFIQGSENRTVTDDWANPIGTPDNNHFKGLMDDVRIFHAAFSAADVTTLYNAEKP